MRKPWPRLLVRLNARRAQTNRQSGSSCSLATAKKSPLSSPLQGLQQILRNCCKLSGILDSHPGGRGVIFPSPLDGDQDEVQGNVSVRGKEDTCLSFKGLPCTSAANPCSRHRYPSIEWFGKAIKIDPKSSGVLPVFVLMLLM